MKPSLRFTFILLLSLVWVKAFSRQDNLQDSIIKKIDTYLETEAKQFKFNGVVLISQKGKIILHKGYGWKDYKNNKLNDTSSIFQIGSVTKQFTATMIFKLQEQGKLQISDPLSKFLPDFPNGDQITLKHLLTHTAGLYNYTNELPPFKFILNKTRSKKAIQSIFMDKPLEFTPGSKFRYTNSGYFLLGMVIESITKKSYERVVRDEIFKPLKMINSGFDFRNLKGSSTTTGYSFFSKDIQSVAAVMDSTVLYAAGAIYSTASDMYHWMDAQSKYKLINPASLEMMITPVTNGYAYGQATGIKFNKPYVTHGGLTSNYSAQVLSFPKDDINIIVLSNVTGDQWNHSANIAQLLYNQTYPWGNNSAIKAGIDEKSSFLGTYVHDKGLKLNIQQENGKLLLNGSPGSGVSKNELFKLAETNIFYCPSLQLDLEIINEGSIQKLISKRSGISQEWIKKDL